MVDKIATNEKYITKRRDAANVVSSIPSPVRSTRYNIKYVIKFVSVFFHVFRFPPPIILTATI